MRRHPTWVSVPRSGFAGFWFPPEVIMVAVRWYLRHGLSYRDGEELLAERGIEVDHVTVYRWVQRFTPLLIDAARPCRHVPKDRWFVDETYVKVTGQWVYLYRAINQDGQVIDVLVSQKRDLVATRRFFPHVLEHGSHPTEVTTDWAPAYPRVIEELIPAACLWVPNRSSTVLTCGITNQWPSGVIASRDGTCGCRKSRFRVGDLQR
jgi:transposase, IS6 family